MLLYDIHPVTDAVRSHILLYEPQISNFDLGGRVFSHKSISETTISQYYQPIACMLAIGTKELGIKRNHDSERRNGGKRGRRVVSKNK